MRKPLALFVTLFATSALLVSCNSNSGGSAADFCDQVDAAEASLDDVDATPEEFLAVLDDLIADAPSAIKGDLETVRDAYAGFADADENDPDALLAAAEAAEDPEVVEASENIEAYGVEECGVEPSDPGTDTTG